MATAAAAEGASPRTAENMGETRRRWQEIESQAAAAANTPQRRPSASTPGSQKVKGVLDKVSLQYKLGRVAASDPSLQQLDLANNAQFLGLTLGQKSRAIEIIATGSALHTLKLHSLNLDNSHARAIAKLLRSRHELQAFGLEGNNLSEAGILEIAAALHGHAYLQEVSISHQRSPLSTAAVGAMVDAMESIPTLVQLGLGTIRDAGMRWRVQSLQSRALERLRQERLKRQGSSWDTLGPNSPPPLKQRRSLNDTFRGGTRCARAAPSPALRFHARARSHTRWRARAHGSALWRCRARRRGARAWLRCLAHHGLAQMMPSRTLRRATRSGAPTTPPTGQRMRAACRLLTPPSFAASHRPSTPR